MPTANMREIHFDVQELACNHCARRLLDGIRALDGVVAVHLLPASGRVDAEDEVWGTVVVKYAQDFVEPEDLHDCVRKLGYSLRESE